jgi:hypothetical protein
MGTVGVWSPNPISSVGGDGEHLDLPRLRSVTRSVCQMGKMGKMREMEKIM